LFSLIKSVLAVKFIGNPVENTAEKVQKAIFSIFLKIHVTFIFFTSTPRKSKDAEYQFGPSTTRICSRNRFLQRFDFFRFFEKCAAIIFYMSHFASFIAQIHHFSGLKH
jgi:hypothetical protein